MIDTCNFYEFHGFIFKKKNWENEKIFQVKNLFHLMIYPEIFEKFLQSQIFTSDKMIATLNIIIIIIA